MFAQRLFQEQNVSNNDQTLLLKRSLPKKIFFLNLNNNKVKT